MFTEMVRAIRAANGNCYFVGGYVRDTLMGHPSKDMDIEVYGIPQVQLAEILAPFGKVNTVGESFAVVKVKTPNGSEFDFAIPRRERKVGIGYRGFEVEADPFMEPKDACSRRDFTINAMMMDPETGEVFDHFNGREHLANKILSATSSRFAEDPVRVLRAMRFAARYGFVVDEPTVKMCTSLMSEFHTIDRDRIMMEFYKMANEAKYPSKGFYTLWNTQWYKCFPEMHKFIREEPATFFSNCAALDRLIAYCDEKQIHGDARIVVYYATFIKGYYGDVEKILQELFVTQTIINRVMTLYKAPIPWEINDASIKTLASNLCGSIAKEPRATIAMFVAVLRAGNAVDKALATNIEVIARRNGVLTGKVLPFVNGNDLKAIGMPPGPEFGRLLADSYSAQLDGEFTSVEQGRAWLRDRYERIKQDTPWG